MFIFVFISFLLVFLNIPSKVSAIVPIQVTACEANINQQGQVDLTDYSLLVQDFMKGLPPHQPPTYSRTDINNSGLVDIYDYSLFVQFFGQTCNSGNTPTVTLSPTPSVTPTISQYGPQGIVGPAGAQVRTCDGNSNCVSCTVSTCSNGKSWDATIIAAKPGDTILLKAGTYTKSSELVIPSGTLVAPITIARFASDQPIIKNVTVRLCSGSCAGGGYITLDGLSIHNDTPLNPSVTPPYSYNSYALLVDNSNSTTKLQQITGSHLDIRGGDIEAIRIRGAVSNVTIRDSYLDGGYKNHVVKILCNLTSSCDPGKVPENISILNNIFTKNKSAFFPKAVCGDEANTVDGQTGSGDLLQLERAGTVVIKNNSFGFNNYEDCLDIKPEGRAGADLEISGNIIDSTDNGTSACTPVATGCRAEGLIIHGTKPAHTGNVQIKNNQFVGGANLFRTAGPTVSVNNNLFTDTRVRVEDALFQFLNNIYQGSSSCGLSNGATCDK